MLPIRITNLLNNLFESQTIRPSYKEAHILYSIMLIGKYDMEGKGIGRYKIKEATGLGGGTVKTLINRLKEQDIIKAYDKIQKGHFLTENGKEIYSDLINTIPIPEALDNPENKFVLGDFAFYTIVDHKFVSEDVDIGIAQRDAAIKIGGTGATCLKYNGKDFTFPDNKDSTYSVKIDKISKSQLGEGDIIIIGGGTKPVNSIISTISATLTLFN